MTLTPVREARFRAAVRALRNAGHNSTILTAASQHCAPWNEAQEHSLRAELEKFREALDSLGVDSALLLGGQEDATGFVTGRTSVSSAPDVDWGVPDSTAIRTSEEVLDAPAAGGADLIFDATLDGLRAVPVSDLDGVGEKAVDRLEKSGIATVFDLMMWVPLRYVDRTQITELAMLRPGVRATFIARVKRVDTNWEKSYVRITLGDNLVTVTSMFFRQMWMRNRFKTGDLVIAQGDIDEFRGALQLASPLVETLEDASAPLMAIYRQSAKNQVGTLLLRRAAVDALRRIPELADPVPRQLIERRRQPSRLQALRDVHLPNDKQTAVNGRDRLAYDELLRLQLALGVLRHAQSAQTGIEHHPDQSLTRKWLSALPWPLTGAQRRALNEIHADMTSAKPMDRLLQGDVGAGKTVVMAGAAIMAVEGDYQSALMAPTEILARQHYLELKESLEPLGITVELLVSKKLPRPRKDVLADIEKGTAKVIIGTSALLTDKVTFAKLGLVLIDEQHRFGVDQRALLSAKGPDGAPPDLLQATATPIPRTAAITTYGDLAVSVLDEKPPGRSPIDTHWMTEPLSAAARGAEPWQAIRDEVAQGHQAFVVCPRVVVSGKESETKQAAAAVETADALAAGALEGLRIGIATGKQPPAERQEQMRAFKDGELDVLVATTVIEVGVSVPNATVIVILDATSFGLAQLHQLRGRVGRSSLQGQCWLVADDANADGIARMEAMVATNDGFLLAENDLQIRGPGALTGTAQAGKEAGLRVADLIDDDAIHMAARADAREILAVDPTLGRHRTLKTEVELALGDDAHYLTKS